MRRYWLSCSSLIHVHTGRRRWCRWRHWISGNHWWTLYIPSGPVPKREPWPSMGQSIYSRIDMLCLCYLDPISFTLTLNTVSRFDSLWYQMIHSPNHMPINQSNQSPALCCPSYLSIHSFMHTSRRVYLIKQIYWQFLTRCPLQFSRSDNLHEVLVCPSSWSHERGWTLTGLPIPALIHINIYAWNITKSKIYKNTKIACSSHILDTG